MTVFVLGAGASLHAGYPLASGLGTALAEWVDSQRQPREEYWQAFASLRSRHGKLDNFEEILTALMTRRRQSGIGPAELNELSEILVALEGAIRDFFSGIRSGRAPLYERLAKDHIRLGDAVITFNYDMDIERALKSEGLWQIHDGYGIEIAEADEPSPVLVYKLHGSTNWRGLLFGGRSGISIADNSLGKRPVLFVQRDFEYLGYAERADVLCAHLQTAHLVEGAMILPSLKKEFFVETSYGREWVEFWDRLWDRAGTALAKAEEIVIIGYSLPDADERAWELLRDRPDKWARITVCCGPSSNGIAERFRGYGFANVCAMTTFENWLERTGGR